jgi:hypothetical protein
MIIKSLPLLFEGRGEETLLPWADDCAIALANQRQASWNGDAKPN